MMKESSCHCDVKPLDGEPEYSESGPNIDSRLARVDASVAACRICLLREIEFRKLELAALIAAA